MKDGNYYKKISHDLTHKHENREWHNWNVSLSARFSKNIADKLKMTNIETLTSTKHLKYAREIYQDCL